MSPNCLEKSGSFDMSLIQGSTASEQADFAERGITNEEKERTKLLEAILRFDLMREATVNKEQLLKKVREAILNNGAEADSKKESSIKYNFKG